MRAHDLRSFGREGEAPLIEWQTHYRLGDDALSEAVGVPLRPELADLIDLAVAVYTTDRLNRRRLPGTHDDGRHWERHNRLEVAVRRPERWDAPAQVVLQELLRWMTDDEWQISLTPGGPRLPRHSETQGMLFDRPLARPAAAGLLSGGLDSLLGAAADLDEDGELLLVSTETLHPLGHCQTVLADGLQALGPRRVRHVRVRLSLTAVGKEEADDQLEESQRTRALTFLAFGAAAAIEGGCTQLRVYENGPGALNLALTPGQRGAMNTRATRPETLKLMTELIRRVTGADFEIVNPNIWRTKAEMVQRADRGLGGLIALSRSCDTAFPARRPNNSPCGRCTSCVLRRQSLICGGRQDLDDLDVAMMQQDTLYPGRVHGVDSALSWMVGQVSTMRLCLDAPDPWGALVRRWPDLIAARDALEAPNEKLVDLLRRYCEEWDELESPVIERLLAAS